MTRNIGSADRTLRIIVGCGLLLLYFVLHGEARWYALIGVIPLATAFLSWCPAYTLLGIKTCPAPSSPK